MPLDEESPRLEAVVEGGARSCARKPVKPVVDVLLPVQRFNLLDKFLEVVPEAPLVANLSSLGSPIIDRQMVLAIGNPALESGPHSNSIDHISNSLEFVILSISRPHSCGLLLLLLNREGIFKILILIL